ncbi:MAG TPA: TMEM175 family protein [Candidatus Cybelea sp.]|nr:TMEM175 family protein [Candidatus Cybelea sp.]
MQKPDDKSQHTIHRLEAFSDVVMGFCLAQLGLNLVLPGGSTDPNAVWGSVAFFIGAFAFIALLWWLHHRTFSTYFVLNTPMIFMNFAMLCALILTLYLFESVMHVSAAGGNGATYFNWFVFAFALVYGLLGVMLAVGLRLRYRELAPADIRWGIGQLTSVVIAVLFFVFVGAYASLGLHHLSIGYVAFAIALTTFILRRVILPRWLRRAVPDTPVTP